jgi:hypothetical protein
MNKFIILVAFAAPVSAVQPNSRRTQSAPARANGIPAHETEFNVNHHISDQPCPSTHHRKVL